MKLLVLVGIVAAAGGLGIGWLIWGGTPPADFSEFTSPKPPTKRTPVPPRKIILGDNYAGEVFGVTSASLDSASAEAKVCFLALDEGDADRRFAKFLLALEAIQPSDVAAIFAKIKVDDKHGRGGAKEWEAFIQRWGEIDAKKALEFADTRETDDGRAWGYGVVLRGWAKADAKAATAWLNEHPDVPKWDEVCGGLLRGIAEKDAWMAIQTAINTPLETDWVRNQVVEYSGQAIVRKGGLEAVKKWYDSIPASNGNQVKLKTAALIETTKFLSKGDPVAAGNWLLEQPPSLAKPEAAAAILCERMAEATPSTALNWLAIASPGSSPLGAAAGKKVLATWKAADPSAAQQWAAGIKDTAFLKKLADQ